jgi:hypothetical protein
MAGGHEEIAKAFCAHYYKLFESSRAQLGPLYSDSSMLSFEGAPFMGSQAIVTKLVSLPFQQCKISVVSFDCQPTSMPGVLIFVTGSILSEGETNPLKFSQASFAQS